MLDQAELTTVTQTRYRCRHIHAAGHQCGSPALRNENFCYHHHATRRPKAASRPRTDEPQPFDLPLVEDRPSALAAASRILQLIAANDIDTARAGKLLHNLQLVIKLLPREPAPEADLFPTPPLPLVHEVVDDEVHGLIAPLTEHPDLAQRDESKDPDTSHTTPTSQTIPPSSSLTADGRPPKADSQEPQRPSAPLTPQELRIRISRSAHHRTR